MRLKKVMRPSPCEVASAWERVYSGREWVSTEKEVIAKELRELPATATRDEVDKAIGNKTWTEIACDSCGDDVDVAIALDLGTIRAHICKSCWEAGNGLWAKAYAGEAKHVMTLCQTKKDPAAEAAGCEC